MNIHMCSERTCQLGVALHAVSDLSLRRSLHVDNLCSDQQQCIMAVAHVSVPLLLCSLHCCSTMMHVHAIFCTCPFLSWQCPRLGRCNAIQGATAAASRSNRFCSPRRFQQGCRSPAPHRGCLPCCQQHKQTKCCCWRVPQTHMAGAADTSMLILLCLLHTCIIKG